MPPSTAVSAKDSDQRENLTSYGWFMQDSIQLTDKWLVMGGLRYDAFDVYAGKGRPFQANTDSSDSKLVPRAGVVYKLTPYVSLYSSYTESFAELFHRHPNWFAAAGAGQVVGSRWQAGVAERRHRHAGCSTSPSAT